MTHLVYALLAILLYAIPPAASSGGDPPGAAPAAPAAPDTPRSHLSTDLRVNEARALIHRGRYAAALGILWPLADGSRADSTDIYFLIGLAAIAAAKQTVNDKQQRTALLDEAIAALRAILVAHPQLTRVRLELARAFFLRGDDALSRRHFERVLAGRSGEVPPVMALNIRRFLHEIHARRRWSSYLLFGLEQNDNINSGNDTKTIYIFGLPFTLNEESQPRSETGLSVLTGVDYRRPFGADGRWQWRLGMDAARTEYEDRELDQTRLQIRSGPHWRISERSEVGLQAIAARRWVGGKPGNVSGDEFGLRFNARHRATAKLGINMRMSGKKNDSRRDTTDTETEYDLGITWLFTPLLQGSLGVGLAHERPDDGERNRGRNANVGLNAVLPKGWTLGGRLEWAWWKYPFNAPLTGERRSDRTRSARLFLLNRGFTLRGFSPQLIVTHERRRSNDMLREYRRTRWDVRWVRQF